MKIGNFKSTKKFLLQVFRANEVAQFPSEDPNFHLVYNSSNLGFFISPHVSSLCIILSVLLSKFLRQPLSFRDVVTCLIGKL